MSVSSVERPVSALRQRMLDDMAMRGLRSDTQRDYVRFVRSFAAFLGQPPDTATAEDIRRFQVHQRESGAPPPTINCSVSALRFFLTVTLDRPDLSRRLVLARYPLKLPAVLSVEEVGQLLESAPGAKYKAILGAAYGAGLRVSEVAALKVDDIPGSSPGTSARVLIRVEQGKGRKDRNAMLSPQLLTLLRLWWKEGKRRGVMPPHGWLFPGRSHGDPISPRQIHCAMHEAAEAGGGDQKAGVAPYPAPQLRHPSAGTGCRYPRHPSPVGAQQARYDRALCWRRHQDDTLGDQSSRTFGVADAGRGTRHCPKCQSAAARLWLAERQADLLPIGYFHVVFALSAEIADVAWQNKAAVYDRLFRAASETMMTIAADPKHLGAHIGITAVLHTWGSAMTHHPHVHMIAPGGGISLDGRRWISSRPAFFLPVRVLGALFRRLFLTQLIELHDAGRLVFFGAQADLTDPRRFLRHLAPLRKKRWVVYAKAPFAGPEAVLAYLSRYTHRVAISNQRLIAYDDTGVTFRYKDYRRDGPDRQRVMTLAPHEFIRRFLLHVLPDGFHRIRHYGLLASSARKANIALARELLAAPPPPEPGTNYLQHGFGPTIAPTISLAGFISAAPERA